MTDLGFCFPVDGVPVAAARVHPGFGLAIWPVMWESRSAATGAGTLAKGEV